LSRILLKRCNDFDGGERISMDVELGGWMAELAGWPGWPDWLAGAGWRWLAAGAGRAGWAGLAGLAGLAAWRREEIPDEIVRKTNNFDISGCL
jgi:hypothetical protein